MLVARDEREDQRIVGRSWEVVGGVVVVMEAAAVIVAVSVRVVLAGGPLLRTRATTHALAGD